VVVSRKRWEIGPRLLLIINRKRHKPFQMRWKSSIIDDLEGPYCNRNASSLATVEFSCLYTATHNLSPFRFSYCIVVTLVATISSLALCLQWYNGLITLPLHLSVTERGTQFRLTLPTVGDSGQCRLNNCLMQDKWMWTKFMYTLHLLVQCNPRFLFVFKFARHRPTLPVLQCHPPLPNIADISVRFTQ